MTCALRDKRGAPRGGGENKASPDTRLLDTRVALEHIFSQYNVLNDHLHSTKCYLGDVHIHKQDAPTSMCDSVERINGNFLSRAQLQY